MTETPLFVTFVVIGVLGLMVWLRGPWKSLMGWVAALSIQYELLPDFRLALSDLFVPTLALTLFFTEAKAEEKAWQKRSSLPTLILIFAALFIILGNTVAYFKLGTIPRWAWLNKDIGLLDLMICFFAITHLVNTREKMNTSIKVLVLSGSALNVLALVGGIARYFLGIPNMMMYASTSMRLAGFMVNPSAYGGFIMCVLMIQLALLLGESPLLPLPRWAQSVNAALLGVACLMTISRSSILGLLSGLLILIAFYRVKAAVRLTSFALLTLLTVGAVAYWRGFSPDVADEFWLQMFSETNVVDRIDMNKAAIDMLFESPTNPITGIGVGTFLARSEHKLDYPYIIHNDFLWLLVETGVLGLGLFGAIVLKSLQNCVSVARARSADSPIAVGVTCSIVGTLIWMMGTEGLWHRHVWFLLGFSEICYRLHMKAKLAAVVRHVPRPRQGPQVAVAHGTLQAAVIKRDRV